MRDIRLQATEHAYDDLPWYGDGERFDSIKECKTGISRLAQVPREHEVTLRIVCSGLTVFTLWLEPKEA